MCGSFDTDTFIAASLCCACDGGQIEILGQVGDTCLGFDETTGEAFPDCGQGLECVEQSDGMVSIPGSEFICVEVFIPRYYDGEYYSTDKILQGYWYFNEDGEENDGQLASKYGSGLGVWNYDADTIETGTWSLTDESGTKYGTWAVDAYDSTIRYDTT